MTPLQHHMLALGLTATTTFGLGLLVFVAGPRRALNRVFGLYSVCIALWGIAELMLVSAPSDSGARLRAIFEWIGVSFIAPTFLHTILLLTGEQRRKVWGIVLAGYLLGAVFVLLHLFSDIVTHAPRGVGYTRYFGNLTLVGCYLPIAFLVLVNVGLSKLWCAYRASSGRRRTQLMYLFWSSLVGYLGGSPDWALALGFYVPILSPFGIYAVSLYSIATTYAVLQHQLFDFNWVVRKSLVYSLVVTLLTIGYFGLVFGVERLSQTVLGYQSIRLSLIAFALMALVFQPLKIGIQRIVDHLIFRAPQQTVAKKLEVYEERAREGERYRAVATLAAGIAHELKNPLTSIKTFIEFFPERHDDPEFREQFRTTAGGAVERLEQITRGLLDFSKPQPFQLLPVDVKAILDDLLALTHHELQKQSIAVTTAYTHNGSFVRGDASKLRQAFLNLILNAKEAMASGGTLTVFTGAVNGHIEIHIADTGCGIHPKDLPHLFEPFFSKKAHGHGLGLSIVHNIIREHRGTITIHSTPGRGTTFTIRLPL